MLRSLTIRDFTIIDRIELDFAAGFCAITGETGAGKSIVIDALALLLGDRADAGLVAEGARRAELSACFELDAEHPALAWLAEQAMDDEGSLLLRRTIPADGSSRAWINGQPATVAQLREVGSRVVEIHGQHQHQRLADARYQRRWLDRHVDRALLEAVAQAARQYADCREQLERLLSHAGSARDHELMKFQLEELNDLALENGELEELEQAQRRLSSVEELQAGYARALEVLDSEERIAAAAQIHQARQALEPLSSREPALAEIVAMIATAAVNLEEAAAELNRLNESLELDPQKLVQVDQRLTRTMDLARKHRIEPEALPAFHAELSERVERIDSFGSDRLEAERRLEAAREAWRQHAEDLHRARTGAASQLSAKIATALGALAMKDARLEFGIEFDADGPVSEDGADRVEILFSANPGQPVKPLRRVASGGELSRLSLAMIIASAEPAAGLVRIFDEIDAGVGGETAHQVGAFLKQASADGQAFCITHLAQVAARADYQLRVAKTPSSGATRVSVQPLSEEQRIGELARMLGSAQSETSQRHARAMLESGP